MIDIKGALKLENELAAYTVQKHNGAADDLKWQPVIVTSKLETARPYIERLIAEGKTVRVVKSTTTMYMPDPGAKEEQNAQDTTAQDQDDGNDREPKDRAMDRDTTPANNKANCRGG